MIFSGSGHGRKVLDLRDTSQFIKTRLNDLCKVFFKHKIALKCNTQVSGCRFYRFYWQTQSLDAFVLSVWTKNIVFVFLLALEGLETSSILHVNQIKSKFASSLVFNATYSCVLSA